MSEPATFPSADLIAKALVMAAMDMCELSVLVKNPDRALAGLDCLRSRWVAYQALCAMHLKADPRKIAKLIGCGNDPIHVSLSVRLQPWWSEARVVALMSALISGAPLQPVFTPDCAFGIMLAIKDRIEERGH